MARARRLRWIQLTSAGAEQLLPARAALRDVVVTNTRGIHADAMADYALGVMVMLRWDFPRLLRAQAGRVWEPRLAVPLAGATVGVVGLGAIGSEIARRARAFGMHVIGIKRTPGGGEPGIEVVTAGRLREVLPRCDFVVLAVPITPATRHLLGSAELAAMKPGACLVNIARGPVVDEAALVAALRAGRLGGAALDVFEEEPLPARHPLWSLPNVTLTPHVAGEPAHYARRVADVFLDNLGRWRRGEPLRNVVDFERGC
ncbi:MAG: D-2-hydroxyacid dehydrogenase [Candidatus Rokubacteria bacterium]|nr:D-2-hydroxyacid dehydrogenase [Candidatus Rokubacteria bacterium]